MKWVQRGGSIGRKCVPVNVNQVTYDKVNNLGIYIRGITKTINKKVPKSKKAEERTLERCEEANS